LSSPTSHRNSGSTTGSLSRIKAYFLPLTAGLIAFGASSPANAQSVTIQSPAPNAKVSSSMPVQASAYDRDGIAYTQIYVDGHQVYTVKSSTVNTSVKLSAGYHRIAVQAKDKLGNIGKSVVYVTVSTTSSSETPSTSTDLTVIDRIEEQTDWQTCGNCGNSGATGATASYTMTRGITDPTKDGSSAQYWIGGPYAYKNAYWYIGHSNSPSTPVKYLRYEFDLYVPAQYASAPQAIEFECQQKASGYVYNYAWQADYAKRQWRVFNYTTRAWEATNVPFAKFSADTWHHIVAEYHAEGSVVVHDALTIDGVLYNVGIKHGAKYVGTTGHYLTNAFQLDLNGSATAYKVYVDGMKVSYK
jgi:Bacterial Ig domain